MAPAQPRHFPALSGGAEQSAGSRGCGIDKILPWLCLPPSYGVFLFRTASKVEMGVLGTLRAKGGSWDAGMGLARWEWAHAARRSHSCPDTDVYKYRNSC